MALDRIQTIQILKTMKVEQQREFDYWAKAKKRHIKPSERAMTLANYSMNIEALQFAVNKLGD